MISKEKSEIKKEKKDPYTPSNTNDKIKALLDFAHIEELFYTLTILKDKEIKTFLEHYRKSEISPARDKKLDLAIRNSTNQFELIDNIRNELIKSLEDEIQEVKNRLSALSKNGKDVYVEKMKLLTTPLKIKVFKATGKKEDFYKIKKIISQVDEQIKPKEEELKLENIEKEKAIKEKEEAEIRAKEYKEKVKKGEDLKEKPKSAPKEIDKKIEQNNKTVLPKLEKEIIVKKTTPKKEALPEQSG